MNPAKTGDRAPPFTLRETPPNLGAGMVGL